MVMRAIVSMRTTATSVAALSHSATAGPGAKDAAKAQMAGGCVDGLRHACRRPVTAAVIGRAQIGAALHHLAGDPDVRLAGVEAVLAPCPARILHRAAGAVYL